MIWYLISAILLFLIGVAHSYLGETKLFTPLFQLDFFKPKRGLFAKQTLRFVWHVLTIAWWGFAALLLLMACGALPMPIIAKTISIAFFIHFLISLIVTRGKHLSWVVFLLISIFSWLGSL